MTALELINLTFLMDRSRGRQEVRIGLIDGPVLLQHRDLAGATIRALSGDKPGSCSRTNSMACQHGTYVAGIVSARRGSQAPAICPDCVLLVRPIFQETVVETDAIPRATPDELASALFDTVQAGARIINLSVGLTLGSTRTERRLEDALDYAAHRGVLIVAAAGNQGTIGSSALTQHPWVIPVVASDLQGRPIGSSNLGRSIGSRGLRAPGEGVTSLGTDSETTTMSGTSVAAPFVTGAIALLWSIYPEKTAAEVKVAVTQTLKRRAALVPPLLDAWGAFQALR